LWTPTATSTSWPAPSTWSRPLSWLGCSSLTVRVCAQRRDQCGRPPAEHRRSGRSAELSP
jgi:hypothetical protein